MGMRAAAAAILVLAWAGPLAAQDLKPVGGADHILSIARGWGGAELEKDKDGNPVIRGRMEGQRYSVYFFGCRDGRDCTGLEFWTWFGQTEHMTADRVNDWNLTKRFVKVAFDKDGDLSLTMDVNLYGGVSARSLDDTFDWWRHMVDVAREEFVEGIGPDPAFPDIPPTRGTRRIEL